MKNKTPMTMLVFLAFLLVSCGDAPTPINSSPSDTEQDNWSIPISEIRDGGPGKDGIPALNNPAFIGTQDVDYMNDEDLIIGIKIGDEIRGYTHQVMDWHEIVNDKIGNTPFALTYCPLTGTAIAWNRILDGIETTFGVSGLLYNSNLMPYDRASDSHWSQIKQSGVNGSNVDKDANQIQVIETKWATWKLRFPESKVISLSTGFNRSYGSYPYGNYKTEDILIFPVSREDNQMGNKERVLGIIDNDAAKIYRFSDMNGAITIEDNFQETNYIIFGDETANYLTAYVNNLKGKRTFTSSASGLPMDDLGNKYNLFGEVISGPNEGESLLTSNAYIGYWMSFPPFFNEDKLSLFSN